MKISIGDQTKDAMKVLGIDSYPFSSEELSSKFRQLIKLHHPDRNKGLHNDEAIKIINAYKHLKNLVINFLVENDEIEATKKMFDEDEDMFSIWDTCPECKGLGKIKRSFFTREFVSCPDCDPLPKRNKIFSFYEIFGLTPSASSGIKTLKCKYCKGTGKFKQRNGRIVDCRACKGTGIWKKVTCRTCGGSGIISKVEEDTIICPTCKGIGKVKINPFNPVIKKGSVLI